MITAQFDWSGSIDSSRFLPRCCGGLVVARGEGEAGRRWRNWCPVEVR